MELLWGSRRIGLWGLIGSCTTPEGLQGSMQCKHLMLNNLKKCQKIFKKICHCSHAKQMCLIIRMFRSVEREHHYLTWLDFLRAVEGCVCFTATAPSSSAHTTLPAVGDTEDKINPSAELQYQSIVKKFSGFNVLNISCVVGISTALYGWLYGSDTAITIIARW